MQSKELKKCMDCLDLARKALSVSDLDSAKNQYAKARELYVNLEYSDKKEAYSHLDEIYERIK